FIFFFFFARFFLKKTPPPNNIYPPTIKQTPPRQISRFPKAFSFSTTVIFETAIGIFFYTLFEEKKCKRNIARYL
ncbi:MAG: hypothetical protein LBV67_00745, partial [Streptococcaceae bacterium]|nr:hypothetical protein [Streptococcaceae bacterium]